MQIELAFEHVNREDIWLKYGYESYIQSLLYSLTEGDFGRFLHDQGYKYKERSYKLFAFSQILESPKAVKRDLKMFVFPSMITVRVSTVENEMMSALMQAIMNSQTVYRLGNNPVKLVDPNGCELWKPDEEGNLVAQQNDNAYSLAQYLNTTPDIAIKMLEEQNYTVNENGVLNLKVDDVFHVDYGYCRTRMDYIGAIGEFIGSLSKLGLGEDIFGNYAHWCSGSDSIFYHRQE